MYHRHNALKQRIILHKYYLVFSKLKAHFVIAGTLKYIVIKY